ncbi:MAG: dynamin family protein [Pseudomonadota bacterium]|nr:dynamin family protein [Pseudomonadota bacterium]
MSRSTDHATRNRLVLTGSLLTDPQAQRITQFNAWKKSIASEITRYRLWLDQHSRDLIREQRLQETLAMFTTDRVRLVLVGEFSRGKTELINALLSRYSGARLFPTRVGRTTMCPVELFSDEPAKPYIKLLPIESRLQPQSLNHFRQQPEAWFQMDLDATQPDQMQQIFREVARTREVQAAEAERLGFDLNFLEASVSQPGYVHIPAWRHALINLHHPLLKLGLSIVDTPGMNAPGVESDLTTQVLPDAQAILYLLTVETGVTASDFSQWTQKIQPIATDKHIALFAVLNKIDLLEADEEPIVASVDRLIRMTAQQLKIPRSHVLPLSAKHGLRAYVNQDEVRLRRSGFKHLQQHLIPQILQTRQQLLENNALQPIVNDIQADYDAIKTRLGQLRQEQTQLADNQQELRGDYRRAQALIEQDQIELNDKAQMFDELSVPVRHQLERVQNLVGQSRFDGHLVRARSVLGEIPSPTTVASAVSIMVSGVRLDLRRLRDDLESLPAQAKRLHDALESVIELPSLSVEEPLSKILQLEKEYTVERNRRDAPKILFENGFLMTLMEIYQEITQTISRWQAVVLTSVEQDILDEQESLKLRFDKSADLYQVMQEQQQYLEQIVQKIPDLERDQQFLQELLFRLQPVEL